MNYADAAKIRKTKFGDLYADRVIEGKNPTSKSVMSEKLKARALGIKQSFGLMNMAKILTFGSNWAPALIGSILGASKEDIRHVTGRKSGPVRNTSSSLDRMRGGGGDMSKSNEILEKMLDFMQQTQNKETEDLDTMSNYNEFQSKMKEDHHRDVMEILLKATMNKRRAEKQMKAETRKREQLDRDKKAMESKKQEVPSAPAPKPAPKAEPAPKPAPKPVTQAKDAADAKRIKDAADAKKAADTAKKQEPIPTTQPSASKVITGAAAVTAVLAGKEALATNIAKYESTASAGKSFAGNEYNAYNRGTKDNKILGAIAPVDFSKITISEYLRRSKLPIDDPDRLFAVGRYQIIPKTMRGLIEQLKIDPDTTYLTPTVQDYLFSKGLIDINRKKVSDYIEGRTNGIDARNEAILQLSKEFASIGVPFDTYRIDKIKQKDGSIKEVRVELKKGSSYYSGIGGNKAHNPPEAVGAALDADRASKAKLQTNDTTVGSSLNDSSVKIADMIKELNSGSGAPVIIMENTNNTSQKTTNITSVPHNNINPRLRR